MKKLVSIFTSVAVALSLVALPVFADTTTTGTSIKGNGVYEKQLKAIKNNLDKTKKLLEKAKSDKAKLEVKKISELKKAQEKDAKLANTSINKTVSIASQIEKLQAAYQKTLDNDKKELATLDANIVKWTANMNNQKAALKKQIDDINTNLAKRLADIEAKIIAANGDSAKINTLTATKTNLTKYADQKKAAINEYIAKRTPTWDANPSVWAAKRTALIASQEIGATYRLTILNIKISELNDPLITPPQTTTTTTPAPVGKYALQVNTKYQKQLDALDAKILKLTKEFDQLNALIPKP